MGQATHDAAALVLEDIEASGETATEHEKLPCSQLLHFYLLLPSAIIFQHFPVWHFLHRQAQIFLQGKAKKIASGACAIPWHLLTRQHPHEFACFTLLDMQL